jgi:hypothetical protein
MSQDASQGTVVTVEAVAIRLVPCDKHALAANGKQTATQNPNGYRHDCPECASTPRKFEKVET